MQTPNTMADIQHDALASERKSATLYRMAMPDHLCPYGLKAKAMLKRHGYKIDDHLLTSREETDAFKREHGVETTPQVFIEGRRVGGYDALRTHFAGRSRSGGKTYAPIIAIFAMTALMALAASWAAFGTVLTLQAFEWFIAISMCALAIQKLRDLEAFATQFLGYDLLARRAPTYAYLYPFGEAFAGVAMIGGVLPFLSGPVAIFIGVIGAASVIKAVYIDKRDLKCACVGGDSNVPLGAISLTENLMMAGMGVWTLVKLFA